MNALRQCREPSKPASSQLALEDHHIIIVGAFAEGLIPQQGVLLKQYLEQEGSRVCLTATTGRRWFRPIKVVLDCAFLGWQQDVFLVQVFSGPSFAYVTLAVVLGRIYGKRIVCILRGGNLPHFATHWYRWVRWVLGATDQLIVPSTFLEEVAKQMGPPVRVIPNLIEIEQYPFRFRDRLEPRFLWMRTFHPSWNPIMALEVFQRIQEFYPNATLTMAGKEGPAFEECRRFVKIRNLSGVSFPGMIPKRKIPDFAGQHDILLNTNDVENMPVTVIEAWALGLPVVATDAGGIYHLVRPGEDALVVPRGQPEAMVAACLRLLTEPELARYLAQNGRRRVVDFTWPATRDSWVSALKGQVVCAQS